MTSPVFCLHRKNEVFYNTRETRIQPHTEENPPCRQENLERLNFAGIEKVIFTGCSSLNSSTRNTEIRSTAVTTCPKSHIIFEFSCTPTNTVLIRRPDSELLEKSTDGTTIRKSISFKSMRKSLKSLNLEEFKKAAYKTMAKELKDWCVGTKGHRELIEFAWKKVRDVVSVVPANHNTLYLCFHTTLVHQHFYEEIKTISGDCSICLEEYSEMKYSQVWRLPCSHVFHRHCINKWLETCSLGENRRCPLCRSHITPVLTGG